MSTTTLFVELLIIGIEALVWVLLLVGSLTDVSLVCVIEKLKGWSGYSALITVMFLAVAYTLGILVDRASDIFYKLVQFRPGRLPAGVGEMRLTVMSANDGMAKFLDYQRSRLRIARATACNLFAVAVSGMFWVYSNRPVDDVGDFAMVGWLACTGVFLFAIIWVGITWSIDKSHIGRLEEAYNIAVKKGRERP